MPKSVAVLTGDLVGSTAAGPESTDLAMQVLAEGVRVIQGWQLGVDPRFTRWRGDGWQIVLHRPGYGLRAALYLIARLRAQSSVCTRLSIGIGQMDQPGTATLADAGGSAFLASGRQLEQMRSHGILSISGEGITALHTAYGELLASLTRRWSVPQAEAVACFIQPDPAPTQAGIAQRLGITPQAVSSRLNAANGQEIRMALQAWEASFDAEEEAHRS